ncbi:MAG TPA: Nramp family divalent metal transporter, partial [Isosphaeraceae bacterium]|nr:Nramp family divalent metal transporter [Isosphaeraceae bacterium]
FVNAAILILAAATFYEHEPVDSIEQAYQLLPSFLGPTAPILFAVALLCAGQSSTLTGTLAGQIVMEGYLHIRIAPWLRRLITRSIAPIPAVVVIALVGESSTQKLLVLSQVILSLQLSFAVIPLIHFTSNKKNMGAFATPRWVQVLAWVSAAVIVGLNAKLVLDEVGTWVEIASVSLSRPAAVSLAAGLYGVVGAVAALLVWVTIKPIFRPAPAWVEAPRLELDWTEALTPKKVRSIGVALEHSSTDAEILNRALSLSEPGRTRLLLLHVADTPMAGVLGSDAIDRHTDADERYLAEVVRVLRQKGYEVDSDLLQGPDRAGEIVSRLKRGPVDLLVVGSHGHGLVRDLLFGQTVDKVRHGLDIPMMIARPPAPSLEPTETPATDD